MKIANVIGATGLVGRNITQLLLADARYDKVRVFVRRPTGLTDPRLDERIVDFEQPDHWSQELTGDELYSALGTTIKQAGSQEAQYRIDYTYQWQAAEAAARNGVSRYLLVSASGANAESRIFYSRMKGELDRAVAQLSFGQILIFRPSLLVGEREKPRRAERFAEAALKAVDWLPGIRRYQAINGATVATAMIRAANQPVTKRMCIYALDEIAALAREDGPVNLVVA